MSISAKDRKYLANALGKYNAVLQNIAKEELRKQEDKRARQEQLRQYVPSVLGVLLLLGLVFGLYFLLAYKANSNSFDMFQLYFLLGGGIIGAVSFLIHIRDMKPMKPFEALFVGFLCGAHCAAMLGIMGLIGIYVLEHLF